MIKNVKLTLKLFKIKRNKLIETETLILRKSVFRILMISIISSFEKSNFIDSLLLLIDTPIIMNDKLKQHGAQLIINEFRLKLINRSITRSHTFISIFILYLTSPRMQISK